METKTGIPVIVNGAAEMLPAGSTLVDLLRQKGIDPSMPGIAIAVNEQVVRRKDWASHTLKPHDRIEIITATQGG